MASAKSRALRRNAASVPGAARAPQVQRKNRTHKNKRRPMGYRTKKNRFMIR
ncbi:MAG: hypothetical protein LBO65_08355 [Spirochaetaceae bacterium]|nr:hypothetical protein [Spirochaetaceae bacterium]